MALNIKPFYPKDHPESLLFAGVQGVDDDELVTDSKNNIEYDEKKFSKDLFFFRQEKGAERAKKIKARGKNLLKLQII